MQTFAHPQGDFGLCASGDPIPDWHSPCGDGQGKDRAGLVSCRYSLGMLWS